MSRTEEIIKKIWAVADGFSQELEDEFVEALAEELELEFYPEDTEPDEDDE